MDLRHFWLPAWIWFIIFLVNFVWSCAPRSAFAAPLSSPECGLDTHCPYGQYCNFQTKSCVNCTDCSKFKLTPGRGSCARGKEECGSCEVGFVMDEGGHCAADQGIPDLKKNKSDMDNPASIDDSNLVWFLGIGICLCVIFFLGCLTFFGGAIYRKKFSSFLQPQTDTELSVLGNSNRNAGYERGKNEKQRQLVEVVDLPDEYERPPPYNIMRESRIYPEIQNERVALLGAVPGGPNEYGNFPAQVYFLQMEEDGVVPDPEQDAAILAITAAAVAPPAPPPLGNEEISASMADLSQLISEESPTQELGINQPSTAPIPILNPIDHGMVSITSIQNLEVNPETDENRNMDVLQLPQVNSGSTVEEMFEDSEIMNTSEDTQTSEDIPDREDSIDLSRPSPHSSMVTSTPRQTPSQNDSGNSSPFPLVLNFIFEVNPEFIVGVNQYQPDVQDQQQQQQPVELANPHYDSILMNMDEGIDESPIGSDMEEEDPNLSRVVPDQTTEDYNSFLQEVASTDDLSMVE